MTINILLLKVPVNVALGKPVLSSSKWDGGSAYGGLSDPNAVTDGEDGKTDVTYDGVACFHSVEEVNTLVLQMYYVRKPLSNSFKNVYISALFSTHHVYPLKYI